jgi:hypothetical protein
MELMPLHQAVLYACGHLTPVTCDLATQRAVTIAQHPIPMQLGWYIDVRTSCSLSDA